MLRVFFLKKKYQIKNGLFNHHDMCGEGEIFNTLLKINPQFSITNIKIIPLFKKYFSKINLIIQDLFRK